MPARVVVTLFLLLTVATASEAPCGFPNYAFPPQPRCELASEEPDDSDADDEQPDGREVAPDPTPATRTDHDASPSEVSSDAPAYREPARAPQPAPTSTGGTVESSETGASPTDETVASSPPGDTPSVTDADRPEVDAADDRGDRGSTGPSTAVVALVLATVSAVGMLLGKVLARRQAAGDPGRAS